MVVKDELNGVNKTWLAGSASPQTNASATQADSAIAGVVVDPTGARVARAFVTTINTDTGWRMVKQTDNLGNYLLSPLSPGPYLVEVQAEGFQRLLQENVQVKPGQTFSLNLKLTIGGGNQSVTVTGSPVAAAPTPPPPPVGDDAAKPIGPVRVSTGTAAGMIISKVDPVYPDEAKAAHVQGTVVLRATISKTGDVEKLNVVSGPPELMVSAIDAVRQWKYKPYLLNGEPTEVQTTININFSLADSTATQAPTSQEYEAKVAALARAAQEYRDLIASAPAPPATAQAQAKLMQIEAELKQAQAQLAMQDARLNAIRTQYNGEPVRKVGGGVAAPVPIYQVEPQFTPEARKAKAAGMVVVQLIVDGQGLPQDVHVIRGFGIGPDGKPDPKMKKAARASAEGMNQNAVNAVKQYKFKPAMQDGKPVPVELNVEVNFQIF